MAEAITQVCEERYVTPPPLEMDVGLSPRIQNLRRLALSFANELDPTERGSAVMDAYDKSLAEPIIIRRAKAAASLSTSRLTHRFILSTSLPKSRRTRGKSRLSGHDWSPAS